MMGGGTFREYLGGGVTRREYFSFIEYSFSRCDFVLHNENCLDVDGFINYIRYGVDTVVPLNIR